jgi:CubicO group peptidase (beta-lactamase class C family)
MRTPGRSLIVALLLSIAGAGAQAQSTPAPTAATKSAADWNTLVSAVITQFDAPGVAIAIVQDGEPVLVRGYGVRESGKAAPVDQHTTFYTASTTKAFTVTGLAILADEGKLRIDDPVVKYLPAFALADQALASQLTVRDLMAQRTGLPRADLFAMSGLSNDLVFSRLRMLAPQAPIRTRFSYSNQMYLTLGLLLESLGGAPWPDFIESRLLKPIGFTDGNARGLGHGTSDTNRAAPHARSASGVAPIDLVPRSPTGAGGVNASAADLAAWLRFQLGDGSVNGTRIVTANVLAAEHAPNTLVAPNATMPMATLGAYGLGWFVHDYFGTKVVQHGGNGEGWSALVWMLPQRRSGIAVLTNMHNSALPYALAYTVGDALLGRPSRDWARDYKTQEARMGPPPLPPASSAVAPTATDAGEYEHALYGRARLTSTGDRLTFSYGTLSGVVTGTSVTWQRSDMAALLGPGRVSISAAQSLVLDAAGERFEFARVR